MRFSVKKIMPRFTVVIFQQAVMNAAERYRHFQLDFSGMISDLNTHESEFTTP